MAEPRILNLPEGEWDGDRHVHPYVQQRGPDGSAVDAELLSGDVVTAEQRSEESRAMFHAAETLLGPLSPLGLAHLMQACIHRLYLPSVVDDPEERRDELDPTGELTAFEQLHKSTLATLAEGIELLTATCPGCGGRNGDLHQGGYVHVLSGESVRLIRCNETEVLVEVDTPVRTIRRSHRRELFEKEYVRGDDVAVLPDGPQEADHGC